MLCAERSLIETERRRDDDISFLRKMIGLTLTLFVLLLLPVVSALIDRLDSTPQLGRFVSISRPSNVATLTKKRSQNARCVQHSMANGARADEKERGRQMDVFLINQSVSLTRRRRRAAGKASTNRSGGRGRPLLLISLLLLLALL